MNIIIVCYPTYGGSGVLATELGHKLAQLGHKIHFVAYKKPVRLELMDNKVLFHKVNVPFYPLFNFQPYELALSSKIVEISESNQIDLIHVHYAIPHAYAAYMAKEMLKTKNINLPIVTTLHGTDITLVGKHPFYRRAVKFSIQNSDIVTSVSQSLKQDTIDFFKIDKEIEVIPNFIDVNRFKFKNENCKQNDKIIISHVSNFRPVKNIRTLLNILLKINNENIFFNMIGEGPELDLAQNFVKQNRINNIKFHGNTDKIEEILCSTDIFLLPSKKESFGLSALEAMASKCALVTSNIGGLPELNIENETGFLVDVNNEDKYVEKINALLFDKNKLEKFKYESFKRAQLFDIDIVVPIYEELYKKLLK